MGDWAVTTHWAWTRPRMPEARDFPSDRWATRLGRVGPGLWQLETLQKYGYYRAPEGTVAVGVQAPDDYLVEYGGGPFSAAWTLFIDKSMAQSGAELEMTGRFNALAETREVGPFAHSLYMERPTPVPAPLVAWPFPSR